MPPMYINVFYQGHINIIGGIETFLFELAKITKANKRDFTIIYNTGDPTQIKRLKKYCRVIAYKDIEKPIKCKRAFFNYDTGPINNFEAEEYYEVVHADFKSEILQSWIKKNLPPDKITQFFAVSENNIKSFKEVFGKDATLLRNPITVEKEPRIMTLVSATRLSGEKGGKRMIKLVEELEAKNISYVWHIFSNDRLPINSENIIYHKPTLDIRKWLQYGDYVVQLSDTEGFPYTPYESLCLGTPLIITKLPILPELKIDETNAIVVDFDLHDLDVEQIYKKAGTFKFKYKPYSNEGWLNLIEGDGEYENEDVTVKAIEKFYDMYENIHVNKGDTYTTVKDRAELLISKNLVVEIKEE